MKIIRDGKEYTLTAEELEQAYRERQHNYLLTDATEQLEEFVRIHFDADEDVFADAVGFTMDDACNENSEHYLLEKIVAANQNTGDCNRAENDIWQDAVRAVLFAAAVNVKVSYQAVYTLCSSAPAKRGQSTRVWQYLTALYPQSHETMDALEAGEHAYLEAALARHVICNEDVRIETTVSMVKALGEMTNTTRVRHPYVRYGKTVDGKLVFVDAEEV